jgi:uncharacterized protein YggT (Ycf19 family)
MLVFILVTFADLFVFVFDVLIVVRVFASYVVGPENRFFRWVVGLTEPLLEPVRRLLPKSSVDFAPIVTFFLLEGLQIVLHHLTGT